MAVGTLSESNSPKTFNSWAVIDFVANKLDMDQIRSSACVVQLLPTIGGSVSGLPACW